MADKTKPGKTPIKNAILKTTATITELDHRTVGSIDQAITNLNNKITHGKLDEKTRKLTEKQIERLQSQRAKTLRLFRSYKKDSRLKSLSSSTVSVYKIWKLLDRNTRETTSKGQEFGKWALQNGGENAVAMLGGAIAVGGLLGTKIGDKAIAQHAWTFVSEMISSLWNTNPGLLIGMGGVAILAGAMAKKGIRKKLEQNAAAKQDAETEMNKGSAYDHKHVAQSATNAASFQKLVAEATMDSSTFDYLLNIAVNPNNDPATIAQANKILAAARAQMKANETQALQAVLVTAMSSVDISGGTDKDGNKVNEGAISKYAAYEEIMELNTKANSAATTTDLSDPAKGGTYPNVAPLLAAYAQMTAIPANLVPMSNLMKGKTEAEFITAALGTAPIPITADYTSLSNEVSQIYTQSKAKLELQERENSGEFTITGNELEIDGSKFDLNDSTNNKGGLAEYLAAIEAACIAAGIELDENGDLKLKGEQLAVKYKTLLETGKAGILAERNAERTGMVK